MLKAREGSFSKSFKISFVIRMRFVNSVSESDSIDWYPKKIDIFGILVWKIRTPWWV